MLCDVVMYCDMVWQYDVLDRKLMVYSSLYTLMCALQVPLPLPLPLPLFLALPLVLVLPLVVS
jgi:hypothetical protein